MEQRIFLFIYLIYFIINCVNAEPGYEHLHRNAEQENVDSIIDVESTEPVDRQMGKPTADYDYYMNARRSMDHSSASDNDVSGSATSALRLPSGEQHNRRPVDELKERPWYGQYTGKSLAMYPSRSYDPYIRRYDRFDEQYHRAYPQYFEDMYVHRQRFDPYDSYSPRVPQYPDPYLMYPDRQLDTPQQSRDHYIKSRRGGYLDEPLQMPIFDSYSNKYISSKLPTPQLVAPSRNERVVYYAHLPEIVRTPYDMSLTRTDRNPAASLVAAPVPYKLNKKKLKSPVRAAADNSTNYKLMF